MKRILSLINLPEKRTLPQRHGRELGGIVEPLEARIAPASVIVVDPHTATYVDADSDLVTIKITHGDLNDAVFVTNPASGSATTPFQLQEIRLTADEFNGTDVTFTVVKKPGGEGLVNVGYVNATGHDLGSVTVPGDLGRINAGNDDATTALKTLSVRSMGLFGKATQTGGSLISTIKGPVTALKIAGDAGAIQFSADAANDADGKIGSVTVGGNFSGGLLASGQVGPVKIDGDLRGSGFFGQGLGSVAIGGSVFGASISGSTIGAVTIGGDLVADADAESGKIDSFGALTSVTIGGSIIGAAGDENTVTIGGVNHAGQIFAVGNIGAVKIGGDVHGGAGDASAKIATRGKLASLTIGGSLIGGAGNYDSVNATSDSGQVYSTLDMGPVKIGLDVLGGAGEYSARILTGGKLTSVAIGGSLAGGGGTLSGALGAGSLGPVTIEHDFLGGTAGSAGFIESDSTLTSVSIGGSFIGGTDTDAGFILAVGDAGPITIGGNLQGGTGPSSGVIRAIAALGNVTIGGSFIGGSNDNAGVITSGTTMGVLDIGHDFLGGAGTNSAGVNAGGLFAGLKIGGSLIGGSASTTAVIDAEADLTTVTIGGDFVGGSVTDTASLDSSGQINSDGRIGSITIGGSIIAGTDDSSGTLTNGAQIRAGEDIGALTVHGSLIGQRDVGKGASLVVIAARGKHTPLAANATTDLALGRFTVEGNVGYAQILAGYINDFATTPVTLKPINAAAQVGPVIVGGDWMASSLVAGAFNAGATAATTDDNVNFGDLYDTKIATTDAASIQSKITSITIAGEIFGTPASIEPNDRFAFVADQIGTLKIGAHNFAVATGAGNDFIALGAIGFLGVPDVFLHETLVPFTVVTTPLVPQAKLVSPTKVTYTDYDGDRVTVTFTKALLTAANVNDIFKFDQADVGNSMVAPQQLQLIDLHTIAAADKTGITVSVVRTANGDGFANIGAIDATGRDLAAVNIKGDLGRITAGDSAGGPGVTLLSVRSMGLLGIDTQASGDLLSRIQGTLGTWNVTANVGGIILYPAVLNAANIGGSVLGARIQADTHLGTISIAGDMTGALLMDGIGDLDSVTIGGSLIGSADVSGGRIAMSSDIGPVKIGGNVLGGTAVGSGSINAGIAGGMTPLPGKIGTITIGGSIVGGPGLHSGEILSNGDMGKVTLGGNIVGGVANFAGYFQSNGKLTGATIDGSLIGAAGAQSGNLTSTDALGAVIVRGDVLGGSGEGSGFVASSGMATSFTLGGSLVGSTGPNGSGEFVANGVTGAVKIGGNLEGAGGETAGSVISYGKLPSITVDGSVLGSSGPGNAEIRSDDEIGTLKIGGNLAGGSGSTSGTIHSDGHIGSAFISGSVLGGSSGHTAEILAVTGFGTVTIGHNLVGGSGNFSGRIAAENKITSIVIHGSMIGGSNATTTALTSTGIIDTSNDISALTIDGNLLGGSLSNTGGLSGSGLVASNNRLVKVTIGGSIVSGEDRSAAVDLVGNASIRAATDIAAFTVQGSIFGNTSATGRSPVIISANHQEIAHSGPNKAIGTFTVGGSVEHATIFGDYTTSLVPGAQDAQIGAVKVGRNWIASNVVVGVVNQGPSNSASDDNINFGDANDVAFGLGPIVLRIASITIGGTVAGTDVGGDHYGFTSVGIDAFKFAGYTAPAFSAATEIIELSRPTGDVTLRRFA